MKEKILRANLYAGLLVFAAAAVLLILQTPFMKTWFYCFAWWSFILVMDSVNFRIRKSSPLFRSPKTFFYAAFISVFVWLAFELFNLRLQNWHYHDLPSSTAERWLGYFLAYATVIPALLEISHFLEGFLKKKRPGFFRLEASPLFLKGCVFVGSLFLILTVAWPKLFFPLVWLCFIFMLEPLNYWLKNDSLLADLAKNDWTRMWSWMLAGLAAGFLWEFWNFFAASRWEYSLPYLDFWRVFQMPVFGYAGFIPFALEVFAFYQLSLWMKRKLDKNIPAKILFFLFLILFYLGCFHLIDTYSLVR
jgi:hypothetical protein